MTAHENLHPTTASAAPAPSHKEIAAEAEVLWRKRGRPTGCDEETWLEAERRLRQVGERIGCEYDETALSDPLSRLNLKSDDVMGELEELFADPPGKETTSL